MRIVSTKNVSAFQHDGVDYEPDDDGVFDVPHDVGEELTAFPFFVLEHEADDTAREARAKRDRDPAELNRRIAQLTETVEALIAERDATGRPGDDESGQSDGGSEPEPKRTPAKKAAPKAPAKP